MRRATLRGDANNVTPAQQAEAPKPGAGDESASKTTTSSFVELHKKESHTDWLKMLERNVHFSSPLNGRNTSG
jgi:hypothetical protein